MDTWTWHQRWLVLKDGILFKYRTREDTQPSKIPLYKCTLEEYQPDAEQTTCTQFQMTTSGKNKSHIFRAKDEQEMHEWLNAILKHKFFIEQIIDDIEL